MIRPRRHTNGPQATLPKEKFRVRNLVLSPRPTAQKEPARQFRQVDICPLLPTPSRKPDRPLPNYGARIAAGALCLLSGSQRQRHRDDHNGRRTAPKTSSSLLPYPPGAEITTDTTHQIFTIGCPERASRLRLSHRPCFGRLMETAPGEARDRGFQDQRPLRGELRHLCWPRSLPERRDRKHNRVLGGQLCP
jgi:hypothetical protein